MNQCVGITLCVGSLSWGSAWLLTPDEFASRKTNDPSSFAKACLPLRHAHQGSSARPPINCTPSQYCFAQPLTSGGASPMFL